MTTARERTLSPGEFRETALAIQREVAKVIVGQDELVRQVLIALIAGGHILLEGVPGLGKTMLVRTLAATLDLHFSRIQFTPDLMPSDIIGTTIIVEDEHGRRSFQFQAGPVFANLVLADEINRATPKTQSALLEAMQEHTVTVSNTVHRLPQPFFVLATQNPIEMEGTYPLPEAQLDRFFFKLQVTFPGPGSWRRSSTAPPPLPARRSPGWPMAASWSGWGRSRGRCRSPATCASTRCGCCSPPTLTSRSLRRSSASTSATVPAPAVPRR